jgi:dGTPase
MPCTRAELEERERQTLAAYAQFSDASRGRAYVEEPPEWRTHYQRDRDRVIHSRSFRRLEYKTQVFLNGSGDHFRTRLTHTIEVAGISRNIARALRLNEDLTEAIALAHDLGHSPFGHRGEAVLNRLMKEHGGFEHNKQSLRIVEQIEQKYPAFPGLNLTWELREGLVKHFSAYDHPSKRPGFDAKSSSLEAQVANLADEIAYYSHDLDDGLDSGLLDEGPLAKHVKIWRDAAKKVAKQCGPLPNESRRYFIIRNIIDDQVRDVVTMTEENIARADVKTADYVRLRARPLVRYSAERRELNLELREYLYNELYFNPEVHGPNLKAGKMLEDLFAYYSEHPEEIGEFSRKRAEQIGWPRAICDYLSGMTDRYCVEDHKRLFGQ